MYINNIQRFSLRELHINIFLMLKKQKSGSQNISVFNKRKKKCMRFMEERSYINEDINEKSKNEYAIENR